MSKTKTNKLDMAVLVREAMAHQRSARLVPVRGKELRTNHDTSCGCRPQHRVGACWLKLAVGAAVVALLGSAVVAFTLGN